VYVRIKEIEDEKAARNPPQQVEGKIGQLGQAKKDSGVKNGQENTNNHTGEQ
jgi:hypothetical protein